MKNNIPHLIGIGVYSMPDASRLTGVSVWRIRRWLGGYNYLYRDSRRQRPPVWTSDIPKINGQAALSFKDLIEVRFVDAFLEQGVSWKTVRYVEQRAAELLKTSHPFATNRFRSDGRTILGNLEERIEPLLIDMANNQAVFDKIIEPYLRGIEFADDGLAVRWRPEAGIVIDPNRSFGQPVLDKEGIPTRILFSAAQSGRTPAEIASWYEIGLAAVESALRYELVLKAA